MPWSAACLKRHAPPGRPADHPPAINIKIEIETDRSAAGRQFHRPAAAQKITKAATPRHRRRGRGGKRSL